MIQSNKIMVGHVDIINLKWQTSHALLSCLKNETSKCRHKVIENWSNISWEYTVTTRLFKLRAKNSGGYSWMSIILILIEITRRVIIFKFNYDFSALLFINKIRTQTTELSALLPSDKTRLNVNWILPFMLGYFG